MTTKIENVKVLFLLYLALKKEFIKVINIKKERTLKINHNVSCKKYQIFCFQITFLIMSR